MPPLSHKIKSAIMIPGLGPYVFDFDNGYLSRTIGYLQKNFPELKNIGVVIGGFTTSLSAGKTSISLDYNPTYFEPAPYDKDVKSLCTVLKENGYNIMLYPMLFVDEESKPWRGDIKPDSEADITHFFKEYSPFIAHYAELTKDYINSFLIGSEFVELLKFKTDKNTFPAVDELIKLASTTRKILGENIKISYAANWGEYHHTDGGWHHLDPLWADENIDFVGIDAYFPLTNNLNQSEITKDIIKDGWKSDGKWDVKDFFGWWSSKHYNPNGGQTAWEPKMKEIIFTEYGFPSVDGATNAPYAYGKGLQGEINFEAQRLAIEATEEFLDEQGIISTRYLYNIDLRDDFYTHPEHWEDGGYYASGHWIEGKIDHN